MKILEKFWEGAKAAGLMVLLFAVALAVIFLLFFVLKTVIEYTGSIVLGVIAAIIVFIITVGIIAIFD